MLSQVAATLAFWSISIAQGPTMQGDPSAAEPQSGVRAGFWWADYDRDGLDDAFVVGADGAARLLHNSGDGSFADVTLLCGLEGLGAASFAAWQDFDRDGAPDVFVGTPSGPAHLMRNAGDGTFQDVTQFVGINDSGRQLAAQWFDYDLDGRSDLSVRTDAGEHLYHALPNGHFEAVDLGAAKPVAIADQSTESSAGSVDLGAFAAADKPGEKPNSRSKAVLPPSGLSGAYAPLTRVAGALPQPPPGTYLISACPPMIADASGAGCMSANSVATLGMLYPLSINLNVSATGNVGIGTTTPGAKLDVVGTARMSDTLTLNPAGDTALNLSSGNLYKGGLLFAHTKGGPANLAIGQEALKSVTSGAANTAGGFHALYSNTSGARNTAGGYRALDANTSGDANTANGSRALFANTTGYNNTASGASALRSNTSGSFNTANGNQALFSNTTGSGNTASGHQALYSNTSGIRNTANGFAALSSNTTGLSNTASGHQALSANTTGTRNTASGNQALLSNTTGSGNTATGNEAMFANSIGTSNTANGVSALRSNTVGYANTASGNQALSTNTSGSNNNANGNLALFSNTVGNYNSAGGARALYANTNGVRNTASGYAALGANVSGSGNTASGDRALTINTTGFSNTAAGASSLFANTSGSSNTASGDGALGHNTSGSRNIALGSQAGSLLTTGSDNIAIGNPGLASESGTTRIGTAGTQTRAFIAGIRGVTTGVGNAIPVVIDSNGQLGTVSSSRRFKQDIVEMGDATAKLLELRPVRFRYKQEQTLPDGSEVPMEYGLIAEEVAEVFSDLVVYGDDGKPFTVKYHMLSSMLLNEMQQLNERIELENRAHARELQELKQRLAALEARNSPAAGAMDGR